MKNLLLFAFVALFAGCTSVERSTSTLEDMGFTHITTQGYSFGCGQDDAFCTKFTAKAPTGRTVYGAVGCGLFKGCTIRMF